MRKICIIVFILIISITMVGITGCFMEPETLSIINSVTYYRDIPGITHEEITAIEELKQSWENITYASTPSIEAFIQSDNKYAGFSAYFTELLSDLFGIPFVHKIIDQSQLIIELEDGIVDLTGEITMSQEHSKKYHMSNPIAQRSLGVLTYGDTVNIETYHELDGLKIGFARATTAEAIKTSYPDINFEAVTSFVGMSMLEMLENNVIDAYIDNVAVLMHNYEGNELLNIHEVLPLVFSPVSLTATKDELKPFISVMNKYIDAGGINVLYELYKEGNNDYKRHVLYESFTDEERAYLEGLTTKIPIVMGTDTYPVSFYNEKEDEFQGISLDVLTEISRLNDIEFDIINENDASWGDILEMLKTGEASIISDLIITEERREYFIWPETPFFSTPYAFFSKSEYPDLELYQIEQSTVGLVEWCATRELYGQWFPNNSNVKFYGTQDEALNALERNEIDLFFNLGYILFYQTNYREKADYKANYTFPVYNDTFFGLNKNEEILCSIIDKSVSYIDIDRIAKDWTSRSFDYTGLIARQRVVYLAITATALFLLLIVLLFLIAEGSKKRKIIEHHGKINKILLDTMPIACNLWNRNYEIVQQNKEVLKLYGLTSEDKYYQQFFALSPNQQPDGKNSKEKTYEMLAKAFETGYERFDWMHHTPDGKPLPCEIILIRIKYNGEYHIAAYKRDLREQKRMMAEIENALLVAQNANSAKSSFLSNISHEMRTPLNAIIGMTSIGKKSEDIEQKNRALNKIGDASTHLLSVINDVLDMSKIEANKLELASTEYFFEEILQNVLTIINFRLDEKRQKLTINLDKNIPEVLVGDDKRLSQVIINLLSNAVKFTPEEGEIHLEASLVKEIGDSVELRVDVFDSGIGISTENQNKLFQAFVQAESGTSRKFGGTGLGLVISKRIVELMDGNIWVESELGKGARFIFTIKALRSNKNGKLANDEKTDSTVHNIKFEGKKLLVVEDVDINREILLALLEETGLEIDCAENGKEAFDMIKAASEKYDIVFMDIQMPLMDGFESTRRIRTLPECKYGNLPIIAMTANVFTEDIQKCLTAGMDDHLGKPLDIDKVLDILNTYLKL